MRATPCKSLASLCWLAGFLAGGARAQSLADGALRIDTYATGLTSPGFFEFLPGSPGGPVDLLVGEIGTGRIRHFRDGVFVADAVDLNVAFLFERGLFGIALHPEFPDSGYVYAYYTASNTGGDTSSVGGAMDNRVVRFTWDGSTLSGETVLLTLPVGTAHNGGALVVGPDGKLYGSIGEAGSLNGQLQNVPTGPPPDDTSMIFRLELDGSAPADNPFFGLGGAMQKVYAYGLRNVFGLDFDPYTDMFWNTDNGAADYDEVNRVPPGTNGGWRQVMGPDARDPEGVSDMWMPAGASYVDPVFSFFESFGITAIHFQRGSGLGAHYDGDLFVAAHNSMDVYHFELTADRSGVVAPDASVADLVADDDAERDLFLWVADSGVITDMETGPDGALYLLRFSGNAQIYRIWRPQTSAAAVYPRAQLLAAPNPFRAEVLVHADGFDAAAPLRVWSSSGQLVRALPHAASGRYSWDGRDEHGRPVAAGVYWLELMAPGGPVRAKVVHLR
jgi:glucose/arabinose dehydrogenase